MIKDQPARPANITNIIEINQGKRAYTTEFPEVPAISVLEVQQQTNERTLILDVRNVDAFARGHIPDALSVPFQNSNFEQWVGWISPKDAKFILVTDSRIEVTKVVHKLAFLGLDNRIIGYLDDGVNAWTRAKQPRRMVTQMSANYLHNLLATRHLDTYDTMNVLDFGEKAEWRQSHIAGAHHMSFKQLSIYS